jgi:hypothetical protein
MKRLVLSSALLIACQSRSFSPGVESTLIKTSSSHSDGQEDLTVFRELPLVASVTQLPWTSDYWATIHGGAAFRWQPAKVDEAEDIDDLQPYINYPVGSPLDTSKLSPIEKLDVYLGHSDWQLTRKERARTLDTRRAIIPEWEGIMHAWSAASLQFTPVAAVTLTGKTGRVVPFESHDIYSLLSLFVHEQSPKPIVLASICPGSDIGSGSGPYAFENEKQSLRRRSCGPLDPARFHTVLTNQIGKRNEGFILDRDRDGEIANNPVVAYESRILNPSSEGKVQGNERRLHLKTVVFLTASTPMNNLDEDEEAYPYETEAYEYELTLDADGRIKAGRWLTPEGSDSNQNIPDFLWKASPVWLNGPIKTLYDKAQQTFAERGPAQRRQLRPIEDMPLDDRQALNSYFNSSKGTTRF